MLKSQFDFLCTNYGDPDLPINERWKCVKYIYIETPIIDAQLLIHTGEITYVDNESIGAGFYILGMPNAEFGVNDNSMVITFIPLSAIDKISLTTSAIETEFGSIIIDYDNNKYKFIINNEINEDDKLIFTRDYLPTYTSSAEFMHILGDTETDEENLIYVNDEIEFNRSVTDDVVIKIFGKSEQIQSTMGRNIARASVTFPWKYVSNHSMTFYYDEDTQVYTINGSTTSHYNQLYKNILTDIKAGDYIKLYYEHIDGTANGIFNQQIYKYRGPGDFVVMYNNSLPASGDIIRMTNIASSDAMMNMGFWTYKDYSTWTADNLRVRVMIEVSDKPIPDHDWEPFVPNKPSLEYLSEIKNASNFNLINNNIVDDNIVDTQSINLPHILRDMPDGTCDYYEINHKLRTKKLVQKIGFRILPKTAVFSNWEKDNCYVIDTPNPAKAIGLNTIGYCNAAKVKTNTIYERDRIGESSSNNNVYWFIDYTRLNLFGTETKEVADAELSKWLTTNDMYYTYKLAVPIITELPYTEDDVYIGKNKYYTDSEVKPVIEVRVDKHIY